MTNREPEKTVYFPYVESLIQAVAQDGLLVVPTPDDALDPLHLARLMVLNRAFYAVWINEHDGNQEQGVAVVVATAAFLLQWSGAIADRFGEVLATVPGPDLDAREEPLDVHDLADALVEVARAPWPSIAAMYDVISGLLQQAMVELSALHSDYDTGMLERCEARVGKAGDEVPLSPYTQGHARAVCRLLVPYLVEAGYLDPNKTVVLCDEDAMDVVSGMVEARGLGCENLEVYVISTPGTSGVWEYTMRRPGHIDTRGHVHRDGFVEWLSPETVPAA